MITCGDRLLWNHDGDIRAWAPGRSNPSRHTRRSIEHRICVGNNHRPRPVVTALVPGRHTGIRNRPADHGPDRPAMSCSTWGAGIC